MHTDTGVHRKSLVNLLTAAHTRIYEHLIIIKRGNYVIGKILIGLSK